MKSINKNSDLFLKKNPEIAKAMRLFDISNKRYEMATEHEYFYTDVSTNGK